jgi:outer membrane protein assembly factor BamB
MTTADANLLTKSMSSLLMKPLPLLILCNALTLAPVLSGAGADWPQWRGPNRNDLCSETGLLKAWPAGGPPLAWKATGLGEGYAGVAIVGDRIYTMGDFADGSQLLALNAADGKRVWATPVGKSGGGGGYPGPRCTPTVDGDLIFALNQHGDLVCAETATGKARWRKNLIKDFGGKMMSGWGYAESPLVDGNKVVCTPGGASGTVIALDKQTGQRVWQSKDFTDSAAYSSLIVETMGDVRQYVQLTDASVAGVAADDGRLLWRADRKGRTAVIPTPVVQDQHVFVASGYGVGCNLFKVTHGSPFAVAEVYANKNMVNHHGGVILLDGRLYGYSDGKGWTCQDFKTGDVVWSDKRLGKGSILYADGHFYLRSEEPTRGTLALIEASPAGYKETGRFDQPDRSGKNTWPHPVIAHGKLFIRDQDLLLSYEVKQK